MKLVSPVGETVKSTSGRIRHHRPRRKAVLPVRQLFAARGWQQLVWHLPGLGGNAKVQPAKFVVRQCRATFRLLSLPNPGRSSHRNNGLFPLTVIPASA